MSGSPSSSNTGSLRNPADFHIKPLVLDSWTRPTYAKLAGRKASDKTIARKFRRYGDFAGLAFWLLLTRNWVPDEPK
jgi:hypothetical protein